MRRDDREVLFVLPSLSSKPKLSVAWKGEAELADSDHCLFSAV